jgi:hypothetical protein
VPYIGTQLPIAASTDVIVHPKVPANTVVKYQTKTGEQSVTVSGAATLSGISADRAQALSEAQVVGTDGRLWSVVPDPVAQAILARSPQAYWRLGDDGGSTTVGKTPGRGLIDQSGNVRDGKWKNSVPPLGPGVVVGDSKQATNFNNTNASNEMGPSLTWVVATRTIMGWVYLNSATTNPMLFGAVDTSVGHYGPLLLQVQPTGLVLYYTDGGGTVRSLVAGGDFTRAKYHMACTYEGGSYRIYVNGVQVGAVADTIWVGSADGYALVNWTASASLDGSLDEVAFFSSGLTAAQVAAIAAVHA